MTLITPGLALIGAASEGFLVGVIALHGLPAAVVLALLQRQPKVR